MIPITLRNKKLYKGEFFNCIVDFKTDNKEEYTLLYIHKIKEIICCPFSYIKNEKNGTIKVTCSLNMKEYLITEETYSNIVKNCSNLSLPEGIKTDQEKLKYIDLTTVNCSFQEHKNTSEIILQREVEDYKNLGYTVASYESDNNIFYIALKTKESLEYAIKSKLYHNIKVI